VFDRPSDVTSREPDLGSSLDAALQRTQTGDGPTDVVDRLRTFQMPRDRTILSSHQN
jgi:hypothetical protein